MAIFQPEDKDAVMAILRRIPQFTSQEVDVAEELIDCYVLRRESSDYHLKTAEVGPKIVGYICYGPTPLTKHTWDIYWMAVDPELQNRGIGGKLMAFAENDIRKVGGNILMIETSSKPDYENTLRFHQRQGYRIEGRIADFYNVGDDRILLVKRI